MTQPSDEARKDNLGRRAAAGMGLALVLGLALGAAMDNIALGLAIGIIVGGIGVAIDRRRTGKNS